MSARYLKLEDGTTWPEPDAVGLLEWRLRYENPLTLSREDALVLASVCAAYNALGTRPDMRAKPPMIRRAYLAGDSCSAGNG